MKGLPSLSDLPRASLVTIGDKGREWKGRHLQGPSSLHVGQALAQATSLPGVTTLSEDAWKSEVQTNASEMIKEFRK